MPRLDEAKTDQFLGDLIDIVTIAFFANSHGNHQDEDLRALHTVENAIALANGAQTPKPSELSSKRFTLLLGVVR